MPEPIKNATPPFRSEILNYYSRDDILNEMMKFSVKREFVGALKNGSYFKRPSIVQYPSDIINMVKNNVTSFHCSVERWSNPMQLSTQTKNYDNIRSGFDLLIDIDSNLGIGSAQLCAELVCKLFHDYGIRNYGVKFSGSRGFHILIPYEAFPEEINYKKTREQYPRIPRIIAEFIRDKIRDKLMEALVKEHTAKKLFELMPADDINPFHWVDIEKGWGERHLFRAPYSLNEKSWLASVPLKNPGDFEIEKVRMKNVKVKHEFMKPCDENEISDLLVDALDWNAKKEMKKPEKKKIVYIESSKKISEQFFPPCIKNILKGLGDGKKRSTFTLINFLRMMNWSWEEIENKITEWNRKNSPPLPTSFITGQLNWNNQQNKIFPASCGNDLFYKSIRICKPDDICKKIKNPIAYPFKKMGISKSYEKKAIRCRICGRIFKNEKSLKMHQARMHGDRVM